MKSAEKAIYNKIDFFMNKHILSHFNPNDIHWWFSLSGGKDSYTMAAQVSSWYKINHLNLMATSITFDQWNNPNIRKINDQFNWLDSRIVDISNETRKATNYKEGDQAPCRICSDIRRKFTDSIIQTPINGNKINFIARGLHLTDTSISFLWRFIKGQDPFINILEENKYYPVKYLYEKTYLVKPLYYVREYETQKYSNDMKYTPICCNCPGCSFPSRRDIIEETVAELIKSDLWEFDIQGISDLIKYHTSKDDLDFILKSSIQGIENKYNHLPEDIFEYAINHYRQKALLINPESLKCFNSDLCLDDIGYKRIFNKHDLIEYDGIPMPRFLEINKLISKNESFMILLLGPFWGAIGLTKSKRDYIFNLQKEYFNLTIDDHFSHINKLLNSYYRRNHASKCNSKKYRIHSIHDVCHCIGCT